MCQPNLPSSYYCDLQNSVTRELGALHTPLIFRFPANYIVNITKTPILAILYSYFACNIGVVVLLHPPYMAQKLRTSPSKTRRALETSQTPARGRKRANLRCPAFPCAALRWSTLPYAGLSCPTLL